MPLNGAGVYSPTAGSTPTDGDTADAADLADFVNDLTTVLNTTISIQRGGTGATTAAAARAALGITSIADPDFDGLLGWDDSAGTTIYYTLGTGLEFNGTEVRSTVSGLSDGDKGDITVSASGATWTVDASAITTAKIADSAITTAKIADDAVTLAKVADAALSGADSTLITGTAGTSGQYAQWNADGDVIGADAPGIGGSANSRSATNLTAFQNTQGKAIACSMVVVLAGAGNLIVEISPDNSTWYKVAQNPIGASETHAVQWIVPDDWYYRQNVGTTQTVIEIY